MDQVAGPGGMVVDVLGAEHDERVVFVHGGGASGAGAFPAAERLAARWRLEFVHRLGYPPSAAVEIEDFEVDARLVVELLGDGPAVHLVGHSYGALSALLAAAARPDAVRSLTLSDPAVPTIARDDELVRAWEDALRALPSSAAWAGPHARAAAFLALVNPSLPPLPDPLPPPFAGMAEVLLRLRMPVDIDVSLDSVRDAGFPVLTISGGGHEAYARIAAHLASELGGTHLSLPAAGHAPQTLPEHTDALEALLVRAGADTHHRGAST